MEFFLAKLRGGGRAGEGCSTAPGGMETPG